MTDRVVIVICAPNGDVREVPIGSAPIVIGRDESADIRVDHKKVSRRHASFRVERGVLWVDDLGSINGIKLNGKRVDKRAEVRFGDRVTVGGYEVRLKDLPSGTLDGDSGPTAAKEKVSPRGRAAAPRVTVEDPNLPVLIGLDGLVKGNRFPLLRGENIVGRIEDCQVPILDGSVSRQHARITVGADRVSIADLGSSHGIYVNDTKVDTSDINNGDRIRIGTVNFRIEMPIQLSARIGPVVARLDLGPRPARLKSAARPLFLAGVLVLTAAGGILLYARQSQRSGWLASLSFRPNASRAGSQGSPPPAPAPASQVRVDPASPPALVAVPPPEPQSIGRQGAAAVTPIPPGPPGGVTMADTGLVGTATSPFGPRDAEGRLKDLPAVDPTFDFDGFVADHLKRAEAFEAENKYAEVRAVLGMLKVRDPVNADARGMLVRVNLADASGKSLGEADELTARGQLIKAIKIYASISEQAPQAKDVRARLELLKPKALKLELEKAKVEAKRKETWARAHARFLDVLELDPTSEPALLAIQELEEKLRSTRARFQPYVPPEAKPKEGQVVSVKDAMTARYSDPEVLRVMEVYLEGAIGKAVRRAEVLAKKSTGARKEKSQSLIKEFEAVLKKYERARTEIANDPSEAWAHLLDLNEIEERLLPTGVESYHRKELEQSIAAAFAERGASLFEQGRHEEAFQSWDAGFKLNSANARLVAGLKQLEQVAEKAALETELAAQRGAKDVCERWRRITRISRGASEIHRRASARARATCR